MKFRKVSSLDLPYHEEFCRQRTDSVFIFYRELRVFSLLSTFSPNSSLAAKLRAAGCTINMHSCFVPWLIFRARQRKGTVGFFSDPYGRHRDTFRDQGFLFHRQQAFSRAALQPAERPASLLRRHSRRPFCSAELLRRATRVIVLSAVLLAQKTNKQFFFDISSQ